jgi:hypothetical protein
MFNPIEGVDFIIDYYAILDIPRDSSKEDIQKALRDNRVQWHPDRMMQLSPEIKKQAEHKNELFGKSEDVLLSSDFKPLYDERLEGFEEKLISKDGRAIVDITKKRVGLDYLLSGEVADDSELIDRAKQMCGHDEESLANLKTLYEADNNNPVIKQLYKKGLTTKLTYVSQLENLAWARAGVANQEPVDGLLFYAEDYSKKVEDTIEKVVREDIPAGLENRLLAHGTGVTSLLTFDGYEAAQGNEVSGIVRDRIVENFTDRCGSIRDIAQKKQEIIEELIHLTDYEYLQKSEHPTDKVDIYVSRGEKVLCGFEMTASDNRLTSSENTFSDKSIQELKQMDWENDSILIRSNPEVEQFMAEVSYVAGKHVNSIE